MSDIPEILTLYPEGEVDRLRDRIELLESALRDVIRDIDEYERINNLAPSPGKTECWQSVAHARVVLTDGETATQTSRRKSQSPKTML